MQCNCCRSVAVAARCAAYQLVDTSKQHSNRETLAGFGNFSRALACNHNHIEAMDATRLACIMQSSAKFPKPKGFHLSYGTAGFRAEAGLLASTVFRSATTPSSSALLTFCPSSWKVR